MLALPQDQRERMQLYESLRALIARLRRFLAEEFPFLTLPCRESDLNREKKFKTIPANFRYSNRTSFKNFSSFKSAKRAIETMSPISSVLERNSCMMRILFFLCSALSKNEERLVSNCRLV